MPCPDVDCDCSIDFHLMKAHAPADIFERYDNFLRKKVLDDASDYIHCANEACNSGGTVDLRYASYISCDSCETSTCTTCRTAWHPGLTHDENLAGLAQIKEQISRNEKHAADEHLSGEYVENNTKECPGPECGARVQKRGGCDHMVVTPSSGIFKTH